MVESILSQMGKEAFNSPELFLHAAIRENDLTKLQHLIDSLDSAELNEALNEDEGCWGKPLHVAVLCDNSAAVAILLGVGASPTTVKFGSDDAPSPLSAAALHGNRAILRQLWQHVDLNLHSHDYRGFESCLVYAAMAGQAEVVDDLLGWWDGWSAKAQEQALCSAAMRWRIYVVELLLSKFSLDQETLDRILSIAADFKIPLHSEMPYNAEYQAVDYFEQQRLIALLVDAGANPNTNIMGSNPVLVAACHIDLVGAMKALLDKGANPDSTNNAGDSALHCLGFPVIINKGSRKMALNETAIRVLLEKNASVCLKNKSGQIPLHFAASGSTLRILQLYLSACPKEEQRDLLLSESDHEENMLHFAASGCKIEIIEYLFSHAGMESLINDASLNGWTPLMCALAQTTGPKSGSASESLTEKIPTALFLLSHGADPLSVTAEGWTPLHCIALYLGAEISDEATQLIEKLVSAGVNVNARALFPAEVPPPPKIRKSYPRTVFGWGHQVAEIIQNPPDGMIIRSKLTPLHFAALHGALGVVKALLRHGADPMAEDSCGTSPARAAGESTRLNNHTEIRDKIINVLMDAGGSY